MGAPEPPSRQLGDLGLVNERQPHLGRSPEPLVMCRDRSEPPPTLEIERPRRPARGSFTSPAFVGDVHGHRAVDDAPAQRHRRHGLDGSGAARRAIGLPVTAFGGGRILAHRDRPWGGPPPASLLAFS
jgi:hypothetical protein